MEDGGGEMEEEMKENALLGRPKIIGKLGGIMKVLKLKVIKTFCI